MPTVKPSVDEVEAIFPTCGLEKGVKQRLINKASRWVDSIHGGSVAHLSEVEGDLVDFKACVAAHEWALASGGQVQSESRSGGSITYLTNPGNIQGYLSLTNYGVMAASYINDDEMSVGVYPTW